MTPASEEHRNADVAFQIVSGLFLTQEVDVKQVIAEVDVNRHRVVQQEAIARTEIHGKAIITSKPSKSGSKCNDSSNPDARLLPMPSSHWLLRHT